MNRVIISFILFIIAASASGQAAVMDAQHVRARTKLQLGPVTVSGISTDGTLSANSDANLVTQRAIKTYVDAQAALSSSTYVPYTGATSNLNLGTRQITSGSITASSDITINASSANGLLFKKAGVNRWFIYKDGLTESGSNTGSDFRISRYSDGGSWLGDALTISRATGAVTTSDYIAAGTYLQSNGRISSYHVGGGTWQAFYNGSGNPSLVFDNSSNASLRGNVTFITDNTYDIGSNITNRPRNGYFANRLVAAVDAVIAGNLNLGAGSGGNMKISSGSGYGLFLYNEGAQSITIGKNQNYSGAKVTFSNPDGATNITQSINSAGNTVMAVSDAGVIGFPRSLDGAVTTTFSQNGPSGSIFTITNSAGFVRVKSWDFGSGDVTPSADNLYSIGSTSNRVKDGYFSGTIKAGELRSGTGVAANSYFRFMDIDGSNIRGYLIALGNGLFALQDAAQSDFTGLIFGANDASSIRIKKNGTAFNFRTGNDGADASITAAAITASSTITASAGTTTVAPFKFTAGTTLTTPDNGAVEYDGTDYYATSGNTRYKLSRTLTATASLDFSSTAAGSSTDISVTVTGAAIGDAVALGLPVGVLAPGGFYTAWVSSTNTVTITFNNFSGSSIDPGGPYNFTVKVIKQ